jgi:hypothetical protein
MRLTDCIDIKNPMTARTQTPIPAKVFLLSLEWSDAGGGGAKLGASAA